MTTSTSSSNREHPRPLLTLAAALTVALLGLAAIVQATMGLNVVSTEDGRRLDVERTPREIPFAAVNRSPPTTLAAMLRADGRVTIVAFIYTSCNSVCTVLGSEFQQMQQTIRSRHLQDKVRLMSISFDPRDTGERLASYALRQRAAPAIWNIVGINAEAQRTRCSRPSASSCFRRHWASLSTTPRSTSSTAMAGWQKSMTSTSPRKPWPTPWQCTRRGANDLPLAV